MSTLSKTVQGKIKGEGFEFQEGTHSYFFNGKRMTGVTTVLGVISKGDALINWAANMAVDYIDNEFKDERELLYDTPRWREIAEEARKAHTRKKDKAAQAGTDVHLWVSEWILADMKRLKNEIS